MDIFYVLVTLTYSKTSGRIHNVNRSLTIHDISDRRILDAVYILGEIQAVIT